MSQFTDELCLHHSWKVPHLLSFLLLKRFPLAYLNKCLLMSFAYFQIGLFLFFIVEFGVFIYFRYNVFVGNVAFKYCSHFKSAACICIFIVSIRENYLILVNSFVNVIYSLYLWQYMWSLCQLRF